MPCPTYTTGAVSVPPGIDAPPGCGNADCSVTVCVPAPNAGSPSSCSCHDCGTHIGAGHREGLDLRVLQPRGLELAHGPFERVHERRRRRAASPHLVAGAEAFEREADDRLLIGLERRAVEQLVGLAGRCVNSAGSGANTSSYFMTGLRGSLSGAGPGVPNHARSLSAAERRDRGDGDGDSITKQHQ